MKLPPPPKQLIMPECNRISIRSQVLSD
eukprot:COSAG02_NODE_12865_length_1479_cov_62.097826_2_plen_27_part_01